MSIAAYSFGAGLTPSRVWSAPAQPRFSGMAGLLPAARVRGVSQPTVRALLVQGLTRLAGSFRGTPLGLLVAGAVLLGIMGIKRVGLSRLFKAREAKTVTPAALEPGVPDPGVFFAYADALQARKLALGREIFQMQVMLYNAEPGSPEYRYAREKIEQLKAGTEHLDCKLACLAYAL